MARKRTPKPAGISAPIMWMGLCVVLAAVVVQTTRSGIDILALLIAGFVLLLVERTLGDWVAESVGPAPTALLFALIAGLCMAYVTTDRGRGSVGRVFAAAETRGYRTAYFRNPTAKETESPDPALGAGGPTLSARRDTSGRGQSQAPTADVSSRPAPPPTAAPAAEPPAAKGVRLTRLTVFPEVSLTGQPITIRANLSFDERGVLPRVVFSVDGRVVGSMTPDPNGVAQLPWKTKVPGQYVVRAELAGGLAGAQLSAMVHVIPGR